MIYVRCLIHFMTLISMDETPDILWVAYILRDLPLQIYLKTRKSY